VDARARRRPSRRPRLDLARLNRVLVVNAGSTSLKLSVIDDRGESQSVASFEEAPRDVDAVVHRVVHGGTRFREPVVLDADVETALRELVELAPLHNAPALEALAAARRAFPDVPHVAAFDTALHPRMRCRVATARSGGSAVSAFTGSRCNGRPSGCACRGSSSAISAAAAR
jgi:acetate kinase